MAPTKSTKKTDSIEKTDSIDDLRKELFDIKQRELELPTLLKRVVGKLDRVSRGHPAEFNAQRGYNVYPPHISAFVVDRLPRAPVATATTTGKATLAFAPGDPAGDPWTYAGEKSTDGGITWSAGTPDDANWAAATTVSGGTVTLTFASLAAGSTKMRAKLTGTNGASAYTPASNTITVT